MKPFDLQKALAGEQVITRCGDAVDHIYYNSKANESHALVAWLKDGFAELYFSDGSMYRNEQHPFDLFMAPKPKVKREGWVNIYKTGMQPYHTLIFATKEKANANKDGVCVIDTVKIEWEEEE